MQKSDNQMRNQLAPHDHTKCMQLAGDRRSISNTSRSGITQQRKPCNVLMYVRKSDDIEEILDALRDCVLHLSQTIKERYPNKRSI